MDSRFFVGGGVNTSISIKYAWHPVAGFLVKRFVAQNMPNTNMLVNTHPMNLKHISIYYMYDPKSALSFKALAH